MTQGMQISNLSQRNIQINQHPNLDMKKLENQNLSSAKEKTSQTHQGQEKLFFVSLSVQENIWRLIFICLILIGSVAVEKVYQFHNNPITVNVAKGHIYDFWVSIISAIVIGILRWLIHQFCTDTIISLLSPERRKTKEEEKRRADQICKWAFDFCYYSLSTVCGYLIVRKESFLPPSMLGSGSCDNMFKNYPEMPEIPFLRIFYLIQTGCHLFTFSHQVFAKFNDLKFYEYALHHGLALFLLWFSYMMNFLQVGIIVLLLHDLSDVFLIAGRTYTDLKNKNMIINIFIYIVSYPLWVYTRNIIYPTCVIKSSFNQLYFPHSPELAEIIKIPTNYMVAMLAALALMHVYWTFYLSKAAIFMVFKRKDKNGYDS